MREFSNEELNFLAELSAQTFESDFLTWIDHMEEAYG